MNKITTFLLILTTVSLHSGCQSESGTDLPASDGQGSVRITTSVSSGVSTQTRAETTELPAEVIPDGYTFPLHITGTYTDETGTEQNYDQTWESVNVYDSPLMMHGNYTATISMGNGESEGPDAAWFAGTADFTILARQTITTTITASLQNAAVRLVIDEWFSDYYSEAILTLRTESGYTSTQTFDFSEATEQPQLLFVKPGTKLFLSGSAVKSQNGASVEFPEAEIGTTAARTLHTVQVRASQVGSHGLTIQVDDTFTELEENLIELNPEA